MRTIGLCLNLRAAEKKTPDQIIQLQQRRLRSLIRFAKRHSPFYAQRLKDLNPDEGSLSLRDIPPITKSELMANFDQVVTDPRLRLEALRAWARKPERVGQRFLNEYVVLHTSGTTGDPAHFVYNRREWDWILALSVTRGVRFKPSASAFFAGAIRVLRRPVRIALVTALNGHFITHVLFRVVPSASHWGADFRYLSVLDPLPSLVDQLNRHQPDLLHCYPTVLVQLAQRQQDGDLAISPKAITCSSEPLTVVARRAIRQAFPNSQLHETYGASEGVHLANQCPDNDTLHVNSDCFILENVNNAGSTLPSGQAGDKMFLTSLIGHSLPLIRYELNDSITTEPDSLCTCGLPFTRISVAGRSDDTFWVKDRRKQPLPLPPIPFEALLLGVDGLAQYQLVQEERNRLRLRYRLQRGADDAEVADQLKSRFDAFFCDRDLSGCIQVNLQRVDTIERDPRSGKLRQILSLVHPLRPGGGGAE